MRAWSTVVLSGCLLMAGLAVAEAANGDLVTTLGLLRGAVVQHNGTRVSVFYGIPYAKPPVGDLRFKPPEPAASWGGTRDATSLPNSCWQTRDTSYNRAPRVEMWNANTNLSEDCLYLNIWIPDTPGPKAVLVWIYGGGFWGGTSTLDIYNGLTLAARNDVIVVSFNYRVGPFGFLYCGTSDCPGNVGLLDQALALKWVKDNAEIIGGSPRGITIFGESAGAVSVGLHLMSPLSMDLFTYATMMSSTPLVYWGIQPREFAVNRTRTLASFMGIAMSDVTEIVSNLRTASAHLLAQTQWKLSAYYFDPPFAPVVDGTFLLKHPSEIMAEGKVKNTSIIVGVVKDEGTYWLLYGFKDIFGDRDPNPVSSSQYATVVDGLLKPLGGNFTSDAMKRLIMNEYYDSVPLQLRGDYLQATNDICGDLLFKCAAVNFARFYSSNAKGQVFVYSYEHRASTNTWPQWVGVPHGYELEIFFGRPWSSPENYTDSERTLSDDIMRRISNFAKTGDPNVGLTTPAVNWPGYTTEDQHYLVMIANQTHVDQGLRHRQCEFWRSQVPMLQAVSYPRSPCNSNSAGRLHAREVLLMFLCIIAAGGHDRQRN